MFVLIKQKKKTCFKLIVRVDHFEEKIVLKMYNCVLSSHMYHDNLLFFDSTSVFLLIHYYFTNSDYKI